MPRAESCKRLAERYFGGEAHARASAQGGEPARIVVAGDASDLAPYRILQASIRWASEWLGATEMSEYVVIYERAEDGGWGAYLPDLPGVVALGSSRDEVAGRIREAVDAYVDEMTALGEPLPAPVAAASTLQA